MADGTDTKDAVNVGQLTSVKDGAVKYWQNEDGSYDKSFVQLEGGEDGTLVTHVRDGAVNKYSSDAVNGSQLWETQQQIEEVQTEAGKHTTVTVNGGMTAPEDGSYTHDENGKLDGNLLLKQTNNDGQIEYDLKLNPDLTLQGEDGSTARVEIGGTNGTIMATKDPTDMSATTTIDGGNIYAGSSITVGTPNENEIVITNKDITGLSNTNWDGTTDNVSRAATEGQLQTVSKDVASLNDGAVKYWKNEDGSYDKSFVQLEGGEDGTLVTHVRDGAVNEYSSDAVNGSQLWETQQQIKDVETTANKHTIVSTTDDSNLTVKNVAKEGEADNYQVTLNDEVVLGDYFDKGNGVLISGNSGTISATNSITVGEDQGLVIDGQKKTIQGLSNTTWTGTTETPNRAATEGQLQDVAIEAAKHTTVSGDKNITVKHEEDSQDYQVTLNDKVYLGGDHTEDSHNIVLDGDRGVIGLGSTIALDGRDGTAVIGGVNITTTSEEETGKAVSTITGLSNTTWEGTTETPDRAATEGQLQSVATEAAKHTTVSGDENITVKHEEGSQDYQVTLNPDVTLKGDNSSIELNGTKGTMQVNQETTEGTDFTNINGNVVSIGYTNKEGTKNAIVIDGGEGTITGLSNTTWDGSTNDISRAATEGQLKAVSDTVNAGWIATDNSGKEVAVNPDNNKLKFAGDDNITVSATTDENNNNAINVKLNDNITLGNGQSAITLNGSPENSNDPALSVGTDKFVVDQDGSLSVSDKFNVDAETGNIYAANNSGSAIMMNDDSVALNAGGNGIAISDEGILLNTNGINEDIKLVTKGTSVSVDNDGATFTNTNTNETTNIDGGTINVGDRLMVEENGSIYATNNNGSTVMINDNGVALNSEGNGVVVSGEGITLNTNGSAVTVDRFNGATFTNTNTTESTNINGANITAGEGENQIKINGAPKADDPALSVGTDKFVVGQDGSLSVSDKFNVDAETGNVNAINSNGSAIMMNDDSVALNASGNGVVISDEGITLNTNGSAVTVDRFNGATFTNTNTGETTNINGDIITTDTVKGLSNTTWDDELATQVANSEELQGTAATQGQLQQAVSAVATEAAKQHTTVSGDDNLTVKSSVNENGGTNYQVTLDDDITLGNPKAGNTEGERSFTINTTDPEGYVPESYETGSGADFIKENGGFMLFATDTQGYGVFGVTAKGSAWAKDFKTYTTDIYGNNTQYSLNDVGDAVAQMSSYYNKENGKSYTVFSRYHNEAEKDNPFETVDGATRDIPLALRDDGAVLIGATIEGDDFTDNGIRINAETETTYDENGKEVTNNVATITGLENTTWTPPAPVATFANEGTETSRAATEAQLNDLYNTVAAYDVNADGTVNYNHITLAGTPYNYGLSRSTDGTPTGGTSITNVAYASGNDGSEAVNVDYLKDAIKDAVKDGPVSSNEKHLDTSKTYTPDKTTGKITIAEVDGTGQTTGNQLVINDVASKAELDSLKTNVGDLNYDKVTGDKLVNGDSVTTAIGKLDNKIDNISGTATDAANNTVTGGTIKDDGTISLTQKDGGTVALDGKLTDSGVVQDGTKFDGETGTLTITSQDKYNKGTSSVTVSGIASKNDIGTVKDTIGATSKEDLKDAYKDADKDGNATTEYITDSETMVDADVALDHAVQDVANTSYANDMILSNRIDNVESRLGDVEERIDKVGAMAAAIANLRTMGYDPEAPTEVAVGVGQYKSETGIALGIFHYPNQDFMLSASISTSGDEVMGGIGATWRIGRKSAEEKAKDEEERILAKAEEIKQAAKRAEVKEQAERHAKLLAEREAKGEPIVPVEESAEQAQA